MLQEFNCYNGLFHRRECIFRRDPLFSLPIDGFVAKILSHLKLSYMSSKINLAIIMDELKMLEELKFFEEFLKKY